MSQKAEFLFEFPKLGTDYRALVNPYHIERATAIVMSEQKADLCIVYFAETLQFICRYTDSPKNGEQHFQFFYKDRSQRKYVYLLVGEEETAWYMEGGIDAVLENMNLIDGHNIISRDFYSAEEADAFVAGVDTVMSLIGHEDGYSFITDEEYSQYREYINNNQ